MEMRIRGGWGCVPDNLKCKTTLRSLGLKPIGLPVAEVWNSYQWIKLYDIEETIPLRQTSEKQRQALEKARQASLAARTCQKCGRIQRNKRCLNIDALCASCREYVALERRIEQTREDAMACIKGWCMNKSAYVILDTETTGLDESAEIVDIAIIDLWENILFESLVQPSRPIPPEATRIHGITNEMVIDAPTWPEVWPEIETVLANKTLLIYNASFDTRILRQECRQHNLPISRLNAKCVMEMYAQLAGTYSHFHKSFRWVKLSEAAEGVDWSGIKAHRAKGDCLLCARLINYVGDNPINDGGIFIAN